MPLYPYQCENCGSSFDGKAAVDQRDDLQTCATCGESAARRVFAPDSVMFNLTYDPDQPGGFHHDLTRRERDLLSIDPALHNDVSHTPSYHLGKKRADRQQKIDEHFTRQKPRKTIKERMVEKWPETKQQLEGPVGPTLARVLRQGMGLEK